MKHKSSLLVLALMCALLCAFGLAGCGDTDKPSGGNPSNEHTHVHNYKWIDNHDGTHKQHCAVTGCDAPDLNIGAHNYGTTGVCVCGNVKPTEQPSVHVHDYKWTDNNDGTHKQHCAVSGCDEPDINIDAHDYGTTGICVCGKEMPHDWALTLSRNDSRHWVKCNDCDKIKEESRHDFTNGDCVCGQRKPTEGIIYSSDDNGKTYCVNSLADSIKSYSEIIVAAEYLGRPVTNFGFYAFQNCAELTDIYIPDTISYMPEDEFAGCDNLRYNEYDNALYLGNTDNPYMVLIRAKSKRITSCTLHENTKVIAGNAFANCDALTSIALADGITVVADSAFNGCRNLQYNEYDNARYLGSASNPYLLLKTAIDKTVSSQNIHKDARIILGRSFSSCANIVTIRIPDNVTYIGSYAFGWCGNLTAVTFGKNVSTVHVFAFDSCAQLTDVIIPDGAVDYGNFVFTGSNMRYNEYGNALYLGSATNPYIILVKAKNADITTCAVHGDAKYIAKDAFKNCTELESVTIPDSVVCIDAMAFKRCKNLMTVNFQGTVAQWNSIVKLYNWTVRVIIPYIVLTVT